MYLTCPKQACASQGPTRRRVMTVSTPSPIISVGETSFSMPRNTEPSEIGPRDILGRSARDFPPVAGSISIECTATISPDGLVTVARRQLRGDASGHGRYPTAQRRDGGQT